MMRLLSTIDDFGNAYLKDDVVVRTLNYRSKSFLKLLPTIVQLPDTLSIEPVEKVPHQRVILQKKLLWSRPSEWTAIHLKTAALYHLNLSKELLGYDLVLKDALPQNLLFDYCQLKLVDIFSITKEEYLSQLVWIDKRTSDNNVNVYRQMFFPYFLYPLLAFASDQYSLARHLLSSHGCNMGRREPHWIDSLPFAGTALHLRSLDRHDIQSDISSLVKKSFSRKLFIGRDFFSFSRQFMSLPFKDGLKIAEQFVSSLDVDLRVSPYATYYQKKNEDQSIEKYDQLVKKQRSLDKILSSVGGLSLLDIGGNTGWYSKLAVKKGYKVVMTDLDEASLNQVATESLSKKIPLLPLKLSFSELIEQQSDSSMGRFPSDVILCLGLIHHLILGQNMSIDTVMNMLSKITINTLVLEFVDLNDNVIKSEPSFFPFLSTQKENYSEAAILAASEKYFKRISFFDSNPSTRKIILLEK